MDLPVKKVTLRLVDGSYAMHQPETGSVKLIADSEGVRVSDQNGFSIYPVQSILFYEAEFADG